MESLSSKKDFLRPLLIGIAGGSCSGKTTLAIELVKTIGRARCAYVDQDSYYKDLSHMLPSDRNHLNFDEPDSIDYQLLKYQLAQILNGDTIKKPKYDFRTHTRVGYANVQSSQIIIIEGILVFCDNELRNLCDLKIGLDIENDLRLQRRVERDVLQRGRSKAEIELQYSQTVDPMYKKHVLPTLKHSDYLFKNNNLDEQLLQILAWIELEKKRAQND